MTEQDDRMRELLRASQRVRKAEEQLAEARAAFRAAVHAAVDAGVSKSAIARAFGVSRQRIQKFFD